MASRSLAGRTETVPSAALAPAAPAPARAPRMEMTLTCTLRRHSGPPISVETVDLGPKGMRVRSRRPLTADETVDFDLPNLPMRVAGHARVLRQQGPHVYVLRFERLPEPMGRCLHALAIARGGNGRASFLGPGPEYSV